MSEKTPGSDADLSKEFAKLVEEEKGRAKREDLIKHAIKGLEILIEKNVDPDMPLYRVQEIIEARREDLRKSLAKRMPRSRELTETVEILDYLNLTQEVLDNLTIHGMDPDTRIDVVLAKLKATLEDMENGVNEDEMKKRSENGKNKL